MSQRVSLSLTDELTQALNKLTRKEGVRRTQLIRKALQDYLFLPQFRSLQDRLSAKARSQGIATDEDVFERVS